MDAREEVISALAAAARRLRLTRTAEAALVGACAGGLCAAALAVAWAAARTSPIAGIALCGMTLAVALLFTHNRFRALLAVPRNVALGVTFSLATACVAAGAAVAFHLHAAAAPMAVVACVMVLGAAGGAVGAALGGVSPAQAGMYHDLKLHLKERLVTAAELSASGASGAIADRVYEQAAAAVRAAQPQRRPVWTRTRATAGAVVLSAVSALTAATLLAPPPTSTPAAELRTLANQTAQLSPQQRHDLAASLRRLAEQVQRSPALREALRAAAAAAAQGQSEDLQRKLEEAGEVLSAGDQAQAARIAREILAAAGVAGNGGETRTNQDGNRPMNGSALGTTSSGAADANAGAGADKPLASRTVVWHPAYARLLKEHAGSAQPAAEGGNVAFGDAWSAAQGQAARDLAGGSVPPEYRPIVRKFFDLNAVGSGPFSEPDRGDTPRLRRAR
jgi:hypothetical protein